MSKALLLIDSECTLCSKTAAFITRHGGEEEFEIASLYEKRGEDTLKQYGLPPGYKDSVVLIEKGQLYLKSDAALRIARKLKGIYQYAWSLRIIPKFIRDAVYNLVAKHRHRIF